MNQTKKYYWLKLHDDYFQNPNIQIIEAMDNGSAYLLFLFKMKLLSVKTEGYLRITDSIPFDPKMLATVTHVDIDIVRSALKIFEEFKLIEILDDSTIYMKCIEELIGSETDVARRVRKHRSKLLHSNNVKQISNTEIETDKDTEIETDKEKEKTSPPKKSFKNPATKAKTKKEATAILLFLNQETGHMYKPTDNTLKFIIDRLNQDYTSEDCRSVIRYMVDLSKREPFWKDHLNYETPFRASKFPKYLDEARKVESDKQDIAEAKQRESDRNSFNVLKLF